MSIDFPNWMFNQVCLTIRMNLGPADRNSFDQKVEGLREKILTKDVTVILSGDRIRAEGTLINKIFQEIHADFPDLKIETLMMRAEKTTRAARKTVSFVDQNAKTGSLKFRYKQLRSNFSVIVKAQYKRQHKSTPENDSIILEDSIMEGFLSTCFEEALDEVSSAILERKISDPNQAFQTFMQRFNEKLLGDKWIKKGTPITIGKDQRTRSKPIVESVLSKLNDPLRNYLTLHCEQARS